jgi:hypothetical protein
MVKSLLEKEWYSNDEVLLLKLSGNFFTENFARIYCFIFGIVFHKPKDAMNLSN